MTIWVYLNVKCLSKIDNFGFIDFQLLKFVFHYHFQIIATVMINLLGLDKSKNVFVYDFVHFYVVCRLLQLAILLIDIIRVHLVWIENALYFRLELLVFLEISNKGAYFIILFICLFDNIIWGYSFLRFFYLIRRWGLFILGRFKVFLITFYRNLGFFQNW